MSIKDVLGFIGGLALFLYGMKMMSNGLESCAGKHLKTILMRLTDHKIKAICVGMFITCLIQSSSAMSVMLIGFLNAKLIDLKRAIWVVMGANIGTTMTGQLIALKLGMIAPILAIIGVAMNVFLTKKWIQHMGEVLGGLGILFMGLEFMSISMIPLRSSPFFLQLMQSITNPLILIIVGAVFTAIIQSSSAAMGILQTLASQGLMSFYQGAYMIFGLNIGTCVTAFLASLSGCINAKRLTCFHIIFNVLGTLIFCVLCFVFPILQWVFDFSPSSPMNQLANLHTLFNIVTTFCFALIDDYMSKVVSKIYS